MVHQARDAALKVRVELRQEGAPRGVVRRGRLAQRPVLDHLLRRDRLLENGGVGRLERQELLHHPADDDPLLERRVELPADALVAQQRQAAHRVVEVGEGGHRQDVARDLLRLLADFLVVLRGVVPARREAGVIRRGGGRDEQAAEVLVRRLQPLDRLAVHRQGRALERRHGAVARTHGHVALADLLRVVERMAVQE